MGARTDAAERTRLSILRMLSERELESQGTPQHAILAKIKWEGANTANVLSNMRGSDQELIESHQNAGDAVRYKITVGGTYYLHVRITRVVYTS